MDGRRTGPVGKTLKETGTVNCSEWRKLGLSWLLWLISWDYGLLGMTLGTGIRTQTHFGNLRNLQGSDTKGKLWSNLRVARPRQVRTLQSPLPPQGSVSAVFGSEFHVSRPLLRKERRRQQRHHPWQNVALFARLCLMMSTVSRGIFTLCANFWPEPLVRTCFTGLVDFCPSRGYPTFDRLSKKACISPVVTFINETVREKKKDTLFSVENLGMSFEIPILMTFGLQKHLLASTDFWIRKQWNPVWQWSLSQTVCPKDFGADWPLLPLKRWNHHHWGVFSGQPLHVLRVVGWIRIEVGRSFRFCFHFLRFVKCLTQLSQLLGYFLQGYKVSMEITWTLVCWKSQTDEKARIVRHGSLLFFMSPNLTSLMSLVLHLLCNDFHAQFFCTPHHQVLIAPTFNPVYYHADRWVLKGNTFDSTSPSSQKDFVSFLLEPRTDR